LLQKSGYLHRSIGFLPDWPLSLTLAGAVVALALYQWLPQQPVLWMLPLLPLGYIWGRMETSQAGKPEATSFSTSIGFCDQKALIRCLLDAMSVAVRYDRNLSLISLEMQPCSTTSQQELQQELEAVADQLTTMLRLPDRIGWFGQGTLVLLLPETNAAAAAKVASRFEELRIRNKHQLEIASVSKTVVISYRFGDDLQSLLERLQTTLSGNRVAVSS